MDANRRQFLAEAEDLIEQVFVELDELRATSHQPRTQRELVDEIFRRIHRIKGSAGSFGLDEPSEIAHEFEHLLSAIRSNNVSLGSETLEACESAATALLESLQLASSGDVRRSRLELFDRIQTVIQMNRVTHGGNPEIELSGIANEFWQSLSDDERQRLAKALDERTNLCQVMTSFDISTFDDQFNHLKQALLQHGQIIASSPVVNEERSHQINFRVLFATESTAEEMNLHLQDFPGASVNSVSLRPAQPEVVGEVGQRTGADVSSASNVIRMDANELDRLISSTHELFLTTTGALDLARSEPNLGKQIQQRLGELDEQVRRSFLGLEEELIGLRMVSLGPVLRRAARAGRAAARLSDKEVDFQIVGASLRLDKVLCNAIVDPLIHLVRNAVDHGIETAGATRSSTKRGLVRIEANTLGGQTCLRVIDNGRGVDPELVADAAVRMGIIDKNTVCDIARSLRLIFRPGFTTLSSPSSISGRGVGLDVVETAVEQVGGEVRVSSEPRKGSTFEIRLPATFGLIQAMLIVSENNYYCIDSSQVVETRQLSDSQIERSDPGEVLKTRRGVLPLIRMRELLGQPVGTSTVEPGAIIVCDISSSSVESESAEKGSNRLGIIVDEVYSTGEMLVRGLGRYAGRWSGVAGAIELRDGTVALVLNLPRLVQARRRGRN